MQVQVMKDCVKVQGELYTDKVYNNYFVNNKCVRLTPIEAAVRATAILQHHDLVRHGGKLERYTIQVSI